MKTKLFLALSAVTLALGSPALGADAKKKPELIEAGSKCADTKPIVMQCAKLTGGRLHKLSHPTRCYMVEVLGKDGTTGVAYGPPYMVCNHYSATGINIPGGPAVTQGNEKPDLPRDCADGQNQNAVLEGYDTTGEKLCKIMLGMKCTLNQKSEPIITVCPLKPRQDPSPDQIAAFNACLKGDDAVTTRKCWDLAGLDVPPGPPGPKGQKTETFCLGATVQWTPTEPNSLCNKQFVLPTKVADRKCAMTPKK